MICQLLGVPGLDREKVRTWSESLFRFHLGPQQAAAGLGALYGYMSELVRARKAAPVTPVARRVCLPSSSPRPTTTTASSPRPSCTHSR